VVDGWVRYRVEVLRPTPPVYRVLSAAAVDVCAAGAEGMRFVHGLPGIRLGFRAAGSGRGELDERVRAALDDLAHPGLIGGWRYAVGEGGGGGVGRAADRLRTADSLAWLGFHAAAPTGGTARIAPWAMSLLMTRSLLAALELPGWDGVGCWDRVTRHESRPLGPALRRGWRDPAMLELMLPEPAQALLADYDAVLRAVGPALAADPDPHALAVALVAEHHNRAGLPSHQQVLVGDALAGLRSARAADPGPDHTTGRLPAARVVPIRRPRKAAR
jgi:hypothetical protein